MGDVNLEIKLSNLDERVIKIEETGGGSGGDGYITSVSTDFNVVNKKLSLSNDVTTKLSKVDTTDNLSVELAKKIDKPASATDGQVLTYNATSNKWEAQNSKGGGSDTSIISDAYDELKSYVKGNYCIYDNALWKALGSSQGTAPTEGTLWTKVSVSEELDELNSSLAIKTKTITVTTDSNGIIYLDDYSDIKILVSVTTENNYSTIITKISGKNAFFVFSFSVSGEMIFVKNETITANVNYI